VIRLRDWPGYLRGLTAAFIFVSFVGYGIGLVFMDHATDSAPQGIVDHYAGNEETMEFGKSTAEMMGLIHTHILGMSVLFFVIGVLFAFSDFPSRWRGCVMIDTMLTLLTTFGGLWLVSINKAFAVWLVLPSSVLMVGGYCLMSAVVFWNCLTPQRGHVVTKSNLLATVSNSR
jgi:hypothetical protein